MTDPEHPYVGRGGLKLRHALDAFALDPTNLVCADLGCNVGGFTDCLLRAGAASVVAVDTAYGQLAWPLRQDPRVTVLERTNALHADPPSGSVDLVVIDLGWTPQRLAIPTALRWVRPGGRIITLIKPHYELAPDEKHLLQSGVLPEPDAQRIAQRAIDAFPPLHTRVIDSTRSPIQGGASRGRKHGNSEWLALLAPAT